MSRILITGASSGIGKACAIEIAMSGVTMALSGRDLMRLDGVAQECRAKGAEVHTVFGDLRLETTVNDLVSVWSSLDGAPNEIVLSAGLAEFGETHMMDPHIMREQIEVNLISPMLLLQACLPELLVTEGGRIVNILSIAAEHVFGQTGAYSASKAGLRMFGKTINAEYRGSGIHVTNLLPGAVDTPIWGPGHPPREKMLHPEHVAKTVAFILNAEAGGEIDELVLMPPDGVL